MRGHILQALSEAYAKAGHPQESWASIDQAEKTLTGKEQLQAYSGVLLVRLSHLTVEEEAEEVAQLIQAHGAGLLSAFTIIKQQGKDRIRKRTPLMQTSHEAIAT